MRTVFSTAPRWVIASHNAGKIKEIEDLVRPRGIAVSGAGEAGLPEPDETETSFAGNALLKARAAAEVSGMVSLADDSGLSVDALGGAPGVYSARWAGRPRDFGRAMARVHDELAGGEDRTARFVCVLALAAPDGTTVTYEGQVEGEIVWPPRGEGGFGYDPIFVPKGETRTFAEMTPGEKRGLSHRGRAFEALIADVFS